MALDIVYDEWANNNARIKYPFSDAASLDNGNGVTIARDLFYDARVYPIGARGRVYLDMISVTDTGLFFHIGDTELGELASGGFLFADPVPELISLADAYGRPAGVLVSSALKLGALPAIYGKGEFLFGVDATEFAASVIAPLPSNGVNGVLLDDGNVLSGELYLVGTNGIVLRQEDGFIRVDMVGDPYAFLHACEAEGFTPAPFCGLRSINGIPPDAQGDFKLTIGGNLSPDNLLRVLQASEGSVQLKALGLAGI